VVQAPPEPAPSDPPAFAVPVNPAMPSPSAPAGPAAGNLLNRSSGRGEVDLGGAVGVSGDTSREAELGAGKWTETGGRSFEELAKSLPDTPVREMSIEGAGLPWGRILFLAALVFLAIAWWTTRAPAPIEGPAPLSSQAPPKALPTRVQAADEGAQVTVTSEPAGALISLDDQSLGRAPASVPVPSDSEPHQLCAVKDALNACRTLTAEELLAEDPYHLDLTASP